MKRLLHFTTTLHRETTIQILKENTYSTKDNFLTFFFSKHYFSGQITESKIRLKNAARSPKNPSPTLDITIVEKNGITEVVIQDDTDDDIMTLSLMTHAITISLAVFILLIGGILSFTQPEKFSMIWTLVVGFVVAGLGFVNSYYYQETIKINTKDDVGFLVKLLKR